MKKTHCFIVAMIASISYSNSFGHSPLIPFEYYQELIFIEIQTEQQDTLFCLFDTGAEISAIHYKTSDRLKLSVVESTQVTGTNATKNVMVVHVTHFMLGDYYEDSIAPTKRDLAQGLTPNNKKLDMILGYYFFQQTIVEIDFTEKELRILNDRAFLNCTFFMNFSLDYNIPRFSGLVNGEIKMDFRLDTGASLFETDDIYVNITTIDWNAIKQHSPTLIPESYLYGTGVNNEQIELPVVRLAKVTVSKFEIVHPYVIVQPEQGYFAQPDAVGFISNNLLEKYDCVAIDYINNRLYYSK